MQPDGGQYSRLEAEISDLQNRIGSLEERARRTDSLWRIAAWIVPVLISVSALVVSILILLLK